MVYAEANKKNFVFKSDFAEPNPIFYKYSESRVQNIKFI